MDIFFHRAVPAYALHGEQAADGGACAEAVTPPVPRRNRWTTRRRSTLAQPLVASGTREVDVPLVAPVGDQRAGAKSPCLTQETATESVVGGDRICSPELGTSCWTDHIAPAQHQEVRSLYTKDIAKLEMLVFDVLDYDFTLLQGVFLHTIDGQLDFLPPRSRLLRHGALSHVPDLRSHINRHITWSQLRADLDAGVGLCLEMPATETTRDGAVVLNFPSGFSCWRDRACSGEVICPLHGYRRAAAG